VRVTAEDVLGGGEAHGAAPLQSGLAAHFGRPTSGGREGWKAELSLEFEERQGRTVIARQLHRGPLRIQRPFYPERNGSCHVYVLHPPGGVVGGDELELAVRGAVGSRALLTTPGATKLYRSPGDAARIHQHFQVQERGVLEWFPHETIAFDGAQAELATHVSLAEGASYAGWEVVCLGRPAARERFLQGRLRFEQRIERGGKLQWLERTEFRGGDAMLQANWGMAGHVVLGTFVIAPAQAPESSWVEVLREALAPPGEGATAEAHERAPELGVESHFAVTQVSGVLVLRYLGDHAQQAVALFRRAWQMIRPRYAGVAAVAPRIWHT
jgi:urease accessory protein